MGAEETGAAGTGAECGGRGLSRPGLAISRRLPGPEAGQGRGARPHRSALTRGVTVRRASKPGTPPRPARRRGCSPEGRPAHTPLLLPTGRPPRVCSVRALRRQPSGLCPQARRRVTRGLLEPSSRESVKREGTGERAVSAPSKGLTSIPSVWQGLDAPGAGVGGWGEGGLRGAPWKAGGAGKTRVPASLLRWEPSLSLSV